MNLKSSNDSLMLNNFCFSVNSFCKKRGIGSVGVPSLIGHGSHDLDGVKHRFIVMPRYGKDVWSAFLTNGRKLQVHTIYRLAIQMVVHISVQLILRHLIK